MAESARPVEKKAGIVRPPKSLAEQAEEARKKFQQPVPRGTKKSREAIRRENFNRTFNK